MKFPTPVYNIADAAVSDGIVTEAPVTDAVVTTAPEPAPEVVVETPNPEAKESPAKWTLKRISEESAKARAATARAEAAERRAQEAEALAERLQAGNRDTPVPTHAPDGRRFTQAEIRAEAERMRINDQFSEDTTAVLNAGIKQFGKEFEQTLVVLNAVDVANNNDFVADVLVADKAGAHVLLDRLAKDPEKAIALAAMSSRQRIAELTRMSVLTAKTETPETKAVPAKTVSKAPAPAPKVEPSSSKAVDGYADNASEEDFTRQFNERMKARAGRR